MIDDGRLVEIIASKSQPILALALVYVHCPHLLTPFQCMCDIPFTVMLQPPTAAHRRSNDARSPPMAATANVRPKACLITSSCTSSSVRVVCCVTAINPVFPRFASGQSCMYYMCLARFHTHLVLALKKFKQNILRPTASNLL